MKVYVNDFVYGRDIAKKLAIVEALSCLISLLVGSTYPQTLIPLSLFTIGIMCVLIFIIVKYCRCPHCKKVITLGVLQATTCPRCKRNLVSGKKVKKR